MKQSLSRAEKLKSRKQIEYLFENGSSIKAYPLLLVWSGISDTDSVPYRVGFSVSKKRFKKAVDRNRVKRLMREAYRRNKQLLPESLEKSYGFMFVYLSRQHTSLQDLDEKIIAIFKRFEKEITR